MAAGAAHWDVGDFRLWESTAPGVVFYVSRTLNLATDGAGRPVAAVTRYLKKEGLKFVTLNGAVTLDLLGATPTSVRVRTALEADWSRALLSSGYVGADPATGPRFLPLPIKDASLSAQMDPTEGAVAGSPGGTTLRLDLTAKGVVAWVAAITSGGAISGTVQLSYSYPRLMPVAMAAATMHGRQCYAVLAGLLAVADDGELSGSADEVDRAWDELVGTGAIDVAFSGLPEVEFEGAREGLLEQVREYLFGSLFEPRAADSSGKVTYAFKWTRAADVPDFPLSISVGGCTWVTGSLTASLAELVSQLGPSVVHDVHESVSVPVLVHVAAFDLVEKVEVGLDFGDVRPPEAMTFDKRGGSQVVKVTIGDADALSVRYRTRVTYTDPALPVATHEDTLDRPDLSMTIVVAPGDWVRRQEVFFGLVEGRLLSDKWRPCVDTVTATLTVRHPRLATPFTTSRALDHGLVTIFPIPVRPDSPAGTVNLRVVGSVGGELVQGTDEYGCDEDSEFVLLENGVLRFVSGSDPLPESGDLTDRLRAVGGKVVVRQSAPAGAEAVRPLSTLLDVPVVPQPTPGSAWAAALAMVVAARDGHRVSALEVAERAGMELDASYDWSRISQAVSALGLVETALPDASPTEWSARLRTTGPAWLVRPQAWFRGVVVAGVSGDGTRDGTWVRVVEPWPVRHGNVATLLFSALHREFRSTAAEPTVLVHR